MSPGRRYPRTDRVNEALREVIGDELERADDSRLDNTSVTGVRVSGDFSTAAVYFDTLDDAGEIIAVLGTLRIRLQKAVNRQLHLRRTPELRFAPDPAIAVGSRVEEILRSLQREVPARGDTAEGGDA